MAVDCVWNVMAHAQKPDFVFPRNGRVHLNRRGRHFSRLLAGKLRTSACRFVLLVQACVLQSCDAYWLTTPFPFSPFTSPPVRHRVPSHFNWTLRFKMFIIHTVFFSLRKPFQFIIHHLCGPRGKRSVIVQVGQTKESLWLQSLILLTLCADDYASNKGYIHRVSFFIHPDDGVWFWKRPHHRIYRLYSTPSSA
jgi:hypothetical protein